MELASEGKETLGIKQGLEVNKRGLDSVLNWMQQTTIVNWTFWRRFTDGEFFVFERRLLSKNYSLKLVFKISTHKINRNSSVKRQFFKPQPKILFCPNIFWNNKGQIFRVENNNRHPQKFVSKSDQTHRFLLLLFFSLFGVWPRGVTGTLSRFEINWLIDCLTSSINRVSMSLTTNFGIILRSFGRSLKKVGLKSEVCLWAKVLSFFKKFKGFQQRFVHFVREFFETIKLPQSLTLMSPPGTLLHAWLLRPVRRDSPTEAN